MQLDRSKQRLVLEGRVYTPEDVVNGWGEKQEELSPFHVELFIFLREWFDESSFIEVHTSGSTGMPKLLSVRKDQMMQSARLTCEVLHLCADDTALLCMPLQYIAGKMMVVRALIAGLNLILRTPSGHPLADVYIPIRFAAMIPLQVYNTLQVAAEKEKLNKTEILIIGGGAIDVSLEKEIQLLSGEIYATYGMTETLSHIALRRLNGPLASSRYTPFPAVCLSLSSDHTLVIQAPLVCDETLVTNDIAQLDADGCFMIFGRRDNLINSGGIKIQTEMLENILKPFIQTPFAITSVPDVKLGQALILLVENLSDIDLLHATIASCIPKWQRPRKIISIKHLPLTETGKTDRANCRLLAAEMYNYDSKLQ